VGGDRRVGFIGPDGNKLFALAETRCMKKNWILVFAIVALVRVAYIQIPFVEPFNNITRQSIGATVARNFYQHGFNFFYPEIDENGKGPYLHNVEMPICTYLAAILYRVTGGVSEGWGRMVSVIFSMLMLLYLFRLTRKIADERTAFWVVLFAGLSPLSLALSRSMQPDMATLAFCVTALFYFYEYQESGKIRHAALSAALFCLGVAAKIYSLYLFVPIIFLAWQKNKARVFFDIKNYVYAVVVSLALIWYWHMWRVGQEVQNLAYPSFHYPPGILEGRFGYFKLFMPPYVQLPAKTLILHILTPLGAICFVRGLFMRIPSQQRLMPVWLGGVVFYLLVMWPTAVIHPYYLLFLVPPVSFFMARGAVRFMDQLKGLSVLKRRAIFTILAIGYIVPVAYYYRLLYFIPADRQAIVDAGKAVESGTPKGSLVAAAYGTSPIQLYYCNRKGWLFDLSADDTVLVEELKKLRDQGANYFVTTEKVRLAEKENFSLYLQTTSKSVQDANSYVIFELGGRYE
jgi:4-amino-4-deoxy-L-arabinose transferase-like glycosyltransferase